MTRADFLIIAEAIFGDVADSVVGDTEHPEDEPGIICDALVAAYNHGIEAFAQHLEADQKTGKMPYTRLEYAEQMRAKKIVG